MALTNAERQAAFKARKAETIEALTQQNSALLAEVAELRAELDRMREKAHRLEVSQLKAQLKAKAPEKAEAEKRRRRERSGKSERLPNERPPFPARQGPFAGALAALGLGRHDLIQREPDALPASQVLGQAGEVLAVLLAHPSQGRLSVGEPVRGARWVRVNVLFKHLRGDVPSPPGCAPDLQRREAGERVFRLLGWANLNLDACPVWAVQMGVFRLEPLFVETHTNGAALAAQVQSPALLREVVPIASFAAHDAALLLDLDGWRKEGFKGPWSVEIGAGIHGSPGAQNAL